MITGRKRRLVGPLVHICDLGYHEGVPMVTPLATTADCEPHTPHPQGYVAHSEWADLMMQTPQPAPVQGLRCVPDLGAEGEQNDG